MIYFDNSATTFPKPECVYKSLDYANRNLAFNAGRGQYKKALETVEYIKIAREKIASFVNCDYKKVSFLSSATESLNMIINGLNISENDNVYVSPFEHNSIIRPLYNLQKRIKFNIFILPFNKDTWLIDEDKLKNYFAINKPKAVFLSSISNVTGYKLPYPIIFKESKKYNSINVLDCAQSFGVLKVINDNVDFIIFAGHKTLYCSFGIAGFINLTDIKLIITKSGGNGSDSLNHEMPESYYERYESGSPNIVAIYGLIKSCDWIQQNNIEDTETKITKYLIKKLKECERVITYYPKNNDIFGIISINIFGYSPNEVANILSDEFDICVRSGYHCCPFVHDFIDTTNIGGTVRISLSAFNTTKEIDEFIDAINTL